MTSSQSAQATRESPSSKQLQIDVWGDLACPYCYIGKNRLDQAIASSLYADAITVRHHSYELYPEMSHEPRSNLEVVAAKYGMSLAQAEQMEGQIVALAHREGLPYTAVRVVANSFDVHRVLQLAGTVGLDDQLLGVLQQTLFSGQGNPYDHKVLTETATQLGIPQSLVEAVLASDEFADAVRADEREARRLGVTGIPFTVFAGRIALSGAASIKDFAKAIDQSWSDE